MQDLVNNEWKKVADPNTNLQDPFQIEGREFIDKVILSELGNIKGKMVVDIGCGNGNFANKLVEKGAKVLGVDVSEQMLMSAKKNFPKLDLFIHDFSSKPFPVKGKFDFAVLELVVMFIKDVDNLLTNVRESLHDNGEVTVVLLHPFLVWNSNVNNQGEINFEGQEDYFTEKLLKMKSEQVDLTYFSRSISWYVNKFIKAGFKIKDIAEPVAKGKSVEMVEKFGGDKALPYIMIVKLAK